MEPLLQLRKALANMSVSEAIDAIKNGAKLSYLMNIPGSILEICDDLDITHSCEGLIIPLSYHVDMNIFQQRSSSGGNDKIIISPWSLSIGAF